MPVHIVDHPLVHDALMELRDVTKHYPQGRRIVRALNGVSLKVMSGASAGAR